MAYIKSPGLGKHKFTLTLKSNYFQYSNKTHILTPNGPMARGKVTSVAGQPKSTGPKKRATKIKYKPNIKITKVENNQNPPVTQANNNVPVKTTIRTRTIRTKLIRKEELFLTMALGEATQLPVLLVGPPGVAKTAALIDYAAAMMNWDVDKAKEKAFIIELDESTKASEIKGRVDMKEFLENKTYKIAAPIVGAEYILINEVDKGSSAIRNAMLSIMREKRLFLGNDIRRCEWKIFAGSCNQIPSDELENPFWDRFVIKLPVERISSSDVIETWNESRFDIEIPMPTQEQLNAVQLNQTRMRVFSDTIHKTVSDRTLTYLPMLVRAVKLIWRMSETQAIMKVCNYVSPSMVNVLSSVIEDTRIVELKNDLQLTSKVSDAEEVHARLSTIIAKAAGWASSFSQEDLEDIAFSIRNVSMRKKFSTIRQDIEDQLDKMMNNYIPQADRDKAASSKVPVDFEDLTA